MIKVLHMLHRFYPLRSGTSERVYYSQPKEGVIHYVIRPCDKNEEENTYVFKEKFIVQAINLNTKLPWRLGNIVRINRLIKAASRIIENNKIDIIYGHNPQNFAEAALRVSNKFPNTPFIYEAHSLLKTEYELRIKNGPIILPKTIRKGYYSYLINTEHKVLKKADAVICQTSQLVDAISKLYNIDKEKCIVAYNGFLNDSINYDPKKIRKKYSLPKKVIAFYGGHLSKENGVDKIIVLIKQMSDTFFVIAGSGDYEEELSHLQQTQPNLRYLGVLNKEDYLSIVSVSNVLLLLRPINFTNHIFLALKVLDAIKMNKIILSTNLKIMQELKNKYNNIFITSLEIEDIKRNLNRALYDSNLNNKQYNNDTISNFTWDNTNKILYDLFVLLSSKKNNCIRNDYKVNIKGHIRAI